MEPSEPLVKGIANAFRSYTFPEEFVLGGLSSSLACCFTNPLEVVKTRFQLQGELRSAGSYQVRYKSFLSAFVTIAKKEGILGLQKGLSPGICYQVVMNGTRLGTFQYLTSLANLKSDRPGHVSYWASFFMGGFAGVCGGFIGSPLYLVKTHLQSRASQEIAVGHQHQHSRMQDAFAHIYKKAGILGLWRGWQAQMTRVAVGSSVQLATFHKIKYLLDKHGLVKKSTFANILLASMSSGLMVTICMSPFDVLATRIYNQPTNTKGKGIYYSGLRDAVVKIVRSEGPLGLYKGASAVFFRVGPHTVLNLVIWDHLRHFYDLFKTQT